MPGFKAMNSMLNVYEVQAQLISVTLKDCQMLCFSAVCF
jgi:hypothetical protein